MVINYKVRRGKLKRIVLFVLLSVVIASSVFAGAPANNTTKNTAISGAAVDSQHTCSVWNVIDSMIVIKTDSCYTYYSFVGTAVMNHDDVLYIGFSGNGGTVTVPAETLIVYSPKVGFSVDTVSFGIDYVDSLWSATDANDTVIVWGACRGGTSMEEIKVSGTLVGSIEPENL